jgi:hypothetical protein
VNVRFSAVITLLCRRIEAYRLQLAGAELRIGPRNAAGEGGHYQRRRDLRRSSDCVACH